MDRQDLNAAAAQAMLEVNDEQLDALTEAFEQMLEYMSVMDGADTEGLEPTTHVLTGQSHLREDEAYTSERQRSLLLTQSKETSATAIRIPRVLP